MNWDQVQGKWKQAAGKVKEKWGKLSDDDLKFVDGKREQHAAAPELYTHVRWAIRGDVPTGAQVRAEYDAQVPAVIAARSSLAK